MTQLVKEINKLNELKISLKSLNKKLYTVKNNGDYNNIRTEIRNILDQMIICNIYIQKLVDINIELNEIDRQYCQNN